jgi:hypothetical protein
LRQVALDALQVFQKLVRVPEFCPELLREIDVNSRKLARAAVLETTSSTSLEWFQVPCRRNPVTPLRKDRLVSARMTESHICRVRLGLKGPPVLRLNWREWRSGLDLG